MSKLSCAKTPGCGIHKFHIAGVSSVDFLGTIFIALIFSLIFKQVPWNVSTIGFLLLAMVVHMFVGLSPIAAKP